jgi:Ran GTPase-activating protein (RanGAP) involved in mRNA processing and transport
MIQAVLSPLQVNLIGNNLKDKGAEIVAASCEHVEELNMSCNSIGASGALAISKVMSRSCAIQHLSLFSNEIGDEGAFAITDSLRTNTSLLVLHLSYNRITCEGAIALAKGIVQHPHLQRIDLSGNLIGDEGASALAAACMRSSSLRDLTLSRNQVGDLGAMSFANVLHRDKCKLQSLRLASNNVGVTGARALALSLRANTALRTIDMRFSDLLVSAGRGYFLEALQCNTTLSACQIVQSSSDCLQSDVDYVTDLNKAGRGIARSKVELLGLALAQVKDEPSLIYGLLKEAPHVWAPCSVNK